MKNRPHAFIAVLAAAVLVACEPAPEPAMEDEPAAAEQARPEMEPAPAIAAPDTTAQAVWEHLRQADYATRWQHWPDRDPFYTGTEPHGALLSTYLNEVAAGALAAGAATMPAGAVIVKENYMPDSTLVATTVMLKAPGYAPEEGNWFWAKYAADGGVEAAGHAEGCLECHSRAADSHDYVITAQQDAGG